MEPGEYQTLYDYETSYWWYRQLHAILSDTLLSLGINNQSYILDAGCGTGQGLVRIRQDITQHCYGFDISPIAAPYWHLRNIHTACVGSINEIPFPDESYDVAITTDVLECSDVRENRAVAELWRVVKPGGYLIVVVPAYDWLMTPEHHQAVHAVRRYTRKRLAILLQACPIQIMRMTYLYSSVFPAVAGYRLTMRLISRSASNQPRSELRPIHPRLNQILYNIVDVERRILRSVNMPFGSSVLAVAQKLSP